MPCPKCSGLLIAEYERDLFTALPMAYIKCINCGLVCDPVMEANRLRKQPPGPKADKRLDHRKFNQEIQAVKVKGS